MRSLILIFLSASPAALAVPTQIGHQGRILDADGLPADGAHSLDFALYDAAEEGTVVWSEVHDVELINGFYSLVLGADEIDNPLDDDLLRDNDLFLELIVDDDEALSPRQALNAVPYARLSDTSTNVSGGVVDASEIRVGGTVVVDGSGAWSGSTPAVDWSELSGVPAGLLDGDDATLTEDEVDAYCADNGYALESDLATVAISGSYDDLSDAPSTGARAIHYESSGSFTVPDGITTLSVYVTGGGGGGSNGESTALDLGAHNHTVGEHNHGGGSHTHAVGDHSHEGGDSHTHVISTYCASSSGCGHCYRYVDVHSEAASGGGGEGSGSTGEVDDGVTDSTALTTDDSVSSGGTVSHNGGDGGSGGGMNVLFTVSPGAECEIAIGEAGAVEGSGTSTTVSCDDQRVECGGGSTGDSGGVDGDDGVCTVAGGTRLSEYKASRFAPGGGGSGGNGSGAAAGQAGTVTIRY